MLLVMGNAGFLSLAVVPFLKVPSHIHRPSQSIILLPKAPVRFLSQGPGCALGALVTGM